MPYYIAPDGTILEQFVQPETSTSPGEDHERVNVDNGGIVLDANENTHLVLTANLASPSKYIVCQNTGGTDLFSVDHDGSIQSTTINTIENTLSSATENNVGGVLVKRETLTHF